MPNYAGTPLESDYEKLKRRRELNNALMQQSMEPYRGTESAVGGRSVDNRWGSGISKIGQALIGAYGNKKLGEESKALGEKYDTGRKEAMDKVMYSLSGQGNVVGPQGPRQPKPDHMKAAMGLLDPYLQHGDVAKALINSQAYGSNRGRGGYSKTFEGKDGRIYSMDMRNPNAQPRLLQGEGGEPLFSPKYTPSALYNQSYGKTAGGNAAEMRPDTGVGAQASAAEAGRQGRHGQPPLTPAAAAAEKSKAVSIEERAFNMQGMTHLIDSAETMLKTGKATGSGIGAASDWLGRFFGVTLPGAEMAADLEVVGGALVGKMPRFEGPQSDPDREYYQMMAGKVGDRTIPNPERLSALKIVRAIWTRYEGKGYITSDEMSTIKNEVKSSVEPEKAETQEEKEARWSERYKKENTP